MFASFYMLTFSIMTFITLYAKKLGESALKRERNREREIGIEGDDILLFANRHINATSCK